MGVKEMRYITSLYTKLGLKTPRVADYMMIVTKNIHINSISLVQVS